MNFSTFIKAWPLLRNQVKTLQLPWLENFAAIDRDPFKILISCILSLRTHDRTTGPASERLFKQASTPSRLAKLPITTIEEAIYPVGFYRVKAETIRDLSRELIDKHNGLVPDTLEGLLKLKGVGRKTANLVLTRGFNKYGICVDTHVHRITNRWGLIRTKNPDESELALRGILPKRYWKELNAVLVAFGQAVCQPLSPFCSRCNISAFCVKKDVGRSR
ncbi:MAG: endonuclease III [Nitrospirae bacterium GWD2_57_9]|nr:MAG: endonuclease III [Nitrospirae bacterium GWD2_57_9]